MDVPEIFKTGAFFSVTHYRSTYKTRAPHGRSLKFRSSLWMQLSNFRAAHVRSRNIPPEIAERYIDAAFKKHVKGCFEFIKFASDCLGFVGFAYDCFGMLKLLKVTLG